MMPIEVVIVFVLATICIVMICGALIAVVGNSCREKTTKGGSEYYSWDRGVHASTVWHDDKSFLYREATITCDGKPYTDVVECITGPFGFVRYQDNPLQVVDGVIVTHVVRGDVSVSIAEEKTNAATRSN